MTYAEQVEAAVVADDPDSATLNRQTESDIAYPTETIRIRALNSVSRDLT